MNLRQLVLLLLVCYSCKGYAAQQDTVYQRGDFLIECWGKTNIDLIVKGKKMPHLTSRGDTIFEDDKYLILGNDDICTGRIFKRYHPKYKFASFPILKFKGKLVKPDFKTDKAAYWFRTQIRDQCRQKGINFAGHYTLAMWGCGSPCQQIAIIDRRDGRIYFSELHEINNELAFELNFTANSKLIIVNSDLLFEHKGYVDYTGPVNLVFFVWNNNKARRLPE